MPAELDRFENGIGRMVYAGQTPWHRDGIALTPEQQTDYAHVAALMDYPLSKEPYWRPTQEVDAKNRPLMTPAADAFYVLRGDTGKVLGTVGPDYEVVPNPVAFEVLKPLVDQGVARIETAGVLREGADAWLLTRWDLTKFGPTVQEVFGDELLPYATVMVNHSGRRGILLGQTAIRVCCANTLGLAERESEQTGSARRWVSVNHRAGARVRLVEAAQELFGGLVDRFEVMAKQYRLLRAARLSAEQFDRLVTDVVAPDPRKDPKFNPEAKLAATVVERALKKRAECRRLWREGIGHTGDESAYEAYNGAVELLDHNRELYPTRAGCYRTASLLTGALADMKGRVVDNLVQFALGA